MSEQQKRRGRGRPRKGTIEWHGDHWDVRPTLADGSRGDRVCQPPGMSEERARDKATALTQLAAQKGIARERPELPAPPAPGGAPPPQGVTLKDWSDAWCDDRARRGLSSVDDDRGRLRKWILPRFDPPLGSRPAQSLTNADLERLVEDIDERVRREELSWKTAKNVWGLVTKMCDDMVRSKTATLRIRSDNIAKVVRGPDEGIVRSKAYLYPSEFLALMCCTRVPIRWRRLIAVNVYTYTRAGELEALGLEDLDLERRVVHVHRAIDRKEGTEKETKTNTPRRFPLEPNLVPLLQVMARERAAGPRLLKMPPVCDLAPRLRQYLEWAGVTRAELFADDATRKNITFHDLRATGITWMAIRGDEPQRIMHRAGHENMSTTMGYVREAEALEYLREDVFPHLPEELFLPGFLPEGPGTWARCPPPRPGAPSGAPGRCHGP
jgi:integrase